MSEPTLEQIASWIDTLPTTGVLARELLALRDRVKTLDDLNDRGEAWEVKVEDRLDALEQSHPAKGDESKGSWHPLGVWQSPNPAADYERSRAERAERERDEAREIMNQEFENFGTLLSRFDLVAGDRDAARADADRYEKVLKRITTYVDFCNAVDLVTDLRAMAREALDSTRGDS